jgi:hypothetical protein
MANHIEREEAIANVAISQIWQMLPDRLHAEVSADSDLSLTDLGLSPMSKKALNIDIVDRTTDGFRRPDRTHASVRSAAVLRDDGQILDAVITAPQVFCVFRCYK